MAGLTISWMYPMLMSFDCLTLNLPPNYKQIPFFCTVCSYFDTKTSVRMMRTLVSHVALQNVSESFTKIY